MKHGFHWKVNKMRRSCEYMFEELTIKNNGDNTYSLSIKNYMDELSLKKFDIEADILEGVGLRINSEMEDIYGSHRLPYCYTKRHYAKRATISFKLGLMPNKKNELYRLILKE
jgi:hypothetical protein